MFSQTAEYALRATVAMAQHPGEPLTTAELFRITKVPQGYLSKVLQMLVRGGVVVAVRGLYGGYQLQRDPSSITTLQVMNAVDPIERIRKCPLDLPEHAGCLCALHQRMDDALAEIERALGATTLEEIIQDTSTHKPLCAGEPKPG